uniref:Uncharacterized protein n=1 Tax=Anguilla anguilla TaxID=7936 RepID=A0A0E9TKV0_ANGAN
MYLIHFLKNYLALNKLCITCERMCMRTARVRECSGMCWSSGIWSA